MGEVVVDVKNWCMRLKFRAHFAKSRNLGEAASTVAEKAQPMQG